MSTSGQAPTSKPNPWLARQPILTRDEKVIGYELLFREGPDETHFGSDAEIATCNTIDTLNIIGLDTVCDGHLAFINCTHQQLVKDYFMLLPPDKVVVEIQETVSPDEIAIGACQRLKHHRYRIALDNFTSHDAREALVDYADFLKIDIRRCPDAESTALVQKYGSNERRMLAQKVETRLQMLTAERDGFTLYQGYFFRHPERMRARHIPVNQASYLRLLQAISAAEIDLAAIEELIKHDASLCYRLLRYLNSPLLGVSSHVQSIRHAMNLLGERELVRWLRMATTLVMGHEKCSDLVLGSLQRARFCELIAPKVPHGKSDLFLMGMLSLMDAILELPMGVVVEGLALDKDTKTELLEAKIAHDTPITPIYQLMLAREGGDWEEVAKQAKKLNLSLPFVNRAFNEAMVWAREMTSGTPVRKQ